MSESSLHDTHESPADLESLGETGAYQAREVGERDHFEKDELRDVLAAYPLTNIKTMREFHRGSRRSPKIVIHSTEGEFLLKRRASRPDLQKRVEWSHSVLTRLDEMHHPVARLIGTKSANTSMLIREECVYELFEFVDGRRYDHSSMETSRAGRSLGALHSALVDFSPEVKPPSGTYHYTDMVFAAAERIQESIPRDDSSVESADVKKLGRALSEQYERAAGRAKDGGYSELPTQVIHGDWHPGNVLFFDAPGAVRPGYVAAVVDFDASRREPRAVDLANGILHFAMRSKRGETPANWPHALSARRLRSFVQGWRLAVGVAMPAEVEATPWLMIEAAIAESIVPVAETGRFATVPGFPFLSMVLEKVRWISSRSKAISTEIEKY